MLHILNVFSLADITDIISFLCASWGDDPFYLFYVSYF